MLKKLFVTAAAAAAVSVPLAGVAWADPMSVGASGQGGESSAVVANGPKSDPSGADDAFNVGAQGGLNKDTTILGITVNQDAGTNWAGHIDVSIGDSSGTFSGTRRADQLRGHFTGNLPGFGECSGLCP